MSIFKMFLSSVLAISMAVCSSSVAFALDDNCVSNNYPMAMTSAEIEEFLENAVPVPVPKSSLNTDTVSVFEHVGSYSYNMETEEVEFNSFTEEDFTCVENSSEGYIPATLVSQSVITDEYVEPHSVATDDNRVKVSDTTGGQWRNTVKLLITAANGNSYIGSGFMIGPNSVATTGHCVYSTDSGGWASSITVIPALNGTSQPYGSATSYNLECGGNWHDYTDNQDDWGIIRINANLGNSTGWLGLRWQSASYNGTTVKAVGYPGSDSTHMYYGSGTVNSSSARTLSGDWYTRGGQSGGPVQSYYSSTGYTAIGIIRGHGSTYSDCLRIDEWIYNKLVSYQTLTY